MPTCGRGGCTGRPAAWLPGWFTAWLNTAGLLAWAAGWRGRTQPRRTASSAAGRCGRRRARRQGCLAVFLAERRLLGQETAAMVIPDSAAPRIRAQHCRAKIGGTTEPFHVSGQRSAVMVAATSGLYGVAVHGAAQAFARVREIDAVKNISLKKTDSVRFKISFEKRLKLKKITKQDLNTAILDVYTYIFNISHSTKRIMPLILQLMFSLIIFL